MVFDLRWTLTIVTVLLISTWPAIAIDVSPQVVGGNPDCADLGYDFGLKIDAGPVGSGLVFTFVDGSQNGLPTVLTSSGSLQDPNNSVTLSSDGVYFDWVSTLGLDAVIVKGGPNANLYGYVPESFGDTGLHSPINTSSGQPYDISHIEFCYDYEVDVSKTAETTFTRTYGWTIDKTATPNGFDLFTGDAGTTQYAVSLTKDSGTDSAWAVAGGITIENNTPFMAKIEDVTDEISSFGSVATDCGVILPHSLPPGDSLVCSYSTPLPNGEGRNNTATVTTSGTVGGNQSTVPVIFGEPTTVVNDSVDVDDSNGESWLFSDSGTVTYKRMFVCGTGGRFDNVATIRQTRQADGASVTVNCYDLSVSKSAETSFDRTWDWAITKTADASDLILSPGQVFQVNYSVEVEATAIDDGFAIGGTITVNNRNPSRAAILTGVSDLVSPDIAATVECPELLVPAAGALQCTYSALLPNGENRTNTATATLQNFSYAADGTASPNGTTDFSGGTSVTWGDPHEEIDECIEVSDSNVGDLGAACADASPATFSYAIELLFTTAECGDNTVDNTASFVAADTGATGEDTWSIGVFVSCEIGCTLTQGYWKTHSEYGPAPYDESWALLPNGADTPFFLSGQSYYEVLWTPPRGGNAYYILAHQYIAAELNALNGASVPAELQSVFDGAAVLLGSYTPDQVAALKGKKGRVERGKFLFAASVLATYNEGFYFGGPPHCDEDDSSRHD